MVPRNEYEHLRMPEEVFGVPNAVEVETLYSCGVESIQQVTAELQPGKWAYGYTINFVNGRCAERRPSDNVGWFRSRSEAKLFFLGYILQYRSYFSDECIREIKIRLLKMVQGNLFH